MPNHVIYDRIWESRKLRECSREAALAYPWIYLVADDYGRFEFNPRRVWGKVFSGREDVTIEDVSGWLDEYERVGLLIRYHIDLAFWSGFKQRPPSKCKPSVMPDPAAFTTAAKRQPRGSKNAAKLQPSGSEAAAPNGTERNGTELKVNVNGNPDASASAPAKPSVASGWSQEAADDFREAYGGPAPKQFFAQVKAVARKYGWSKTRPALQALLRETPLEFLSIPKVLAVRIEAGSAPKALKYTAQQPAAEEIPPEEHSARVERIKAMLAAKASAGGAL